MIRSLKLKWLLFPGAFLMALAIGWSMPPPPLPKLDEQKDNWYLPDSALSSGNDRALETTRFLGDTVSDEGSQGPWRLAGISNDSTALIELLSSKEMIRLRANDNMPDGQLLLAVYPDRIEVEQNNCMRTYKLYNSEPVNTTGKGCPEEQPSEDGDESKGSSQQ